MESGGVNRGIKNLSDMDIIPPQPTREEEIAYLDSLERELRNQPFRLKSFTPDPSRKKRIELHEEYCQYNKSYWRTFTLGSFVVSPVALWLASMAPSKANFQSIPYRKYPIQFKFRFWGFFAFFEYFLAKGFTKIFMNNTLLEEYKYPLYKLKERKL